MWEAKTGVLSFLQLLPVDSNKEQINSHSHGCVQYIIKLVDVWLKRNFVWSEMKVACLAADLTSQCDEQQVSIPVSLQDTTAC